MGARVSRRRLILHWIAPALLVAATLIFAAELSASDPGYSAEPYWTNPETHQVERCAGDARLVCEHQGG